MPTNPPVKNGNENSQQSGNGEKPVPENRWKKAWELAKTPDGKFLIRAIASIFSILIIPLLTITASWISDAKDRKIHEQELVIQVAEHQLNVLKQNISETQSSMTATAGIIAATNTAQEVYIAKTQEAIHEMQTQLAINVEATFTEVARDDEIKLEKNIACLNTADPNDEQVSQVFTSWLASKDLKFNQPIKTPYWDRVAGFPNHEYMFVVFTNHGIPITFTKVLNSTREPHNPEVDGWDEERAITGYGSIGQGWIYMLLVADRPATLMSGITSTQPAGMPGEPFFPNLSPALTGSKSNPIIRCGQRINWNVSHITLDLLYHPEKHIDDRILSVVISDSSDSVSELIEP